MVLEVGSMFQKVSNMYVLYWIKKRNNFVGSYYAFVLCTLNPVGPLGETWSSLDPLSGQHAVVDDHACRLVMINMTSHDGDVPF